MADIELIIKIPEEIYKSSKKECNENNSLIIDTYTYAIANGTPLSKGHGRIIDENKISKCEQIGLAMKDSNTNRCLLTDAPTIVEADKEYEAEVITRGNCMICGKELAEGLFICKECGDKANSGK